MYGPDDVTMLLQWCYVDVTMMLCWCYNNVCCNDVVAMMLQWFYEDVTMMLFGCYNDVCCNDVMLMLQWCCVDVTTMFFAMMLQWFYEDVTMLLQLHYFYVINMFWYQQFLFRFAVDCSDNDWKTNFWHEFEIVEL